MNSTSVAAVVLAAGLSRRMGSFKLTLPWGQGTVISHVVATLEAAGLSEVVVITGHQAGAVMDALKGSSARSITNPCYASGEMISSIQAGLAAVSGEADAVLLCLGDQPQMEPGTIKAVLAGGQANLYRNVIIPSYNMHGGHPLLLPRWLWPDILSTQTDLRSVLAAHRDRIQYITMTSATILADLDTAADYERWRGAAKGTPDANG